MGMTLQALYKAWWLIEASTLAVREKRKSEGPKFPARAIWWRET